MIEKLSGVVLKEWWWGWALSSITNFPAVVTVFSVVSAVVLFAILRYEYRNWNRMWAAEGLELMAAAGCGGLLTLAFYCLPVVIVFAVGSALALAVCELFSYLVVLSCGGKKNESK